jgi:hypothetical protein
MYLKSTELSSRTDCYWIQRENGYILNEAVRDRMEDIRDQTVFPGWIQNINELVDIVHDCLQVDSGRRPKAAKLKDQMADVAERLQNTPPET